VSKYTFMYKGWDIPQMSHLLLNLLIAEKKKL